MTDSREDWIRRLVEEARPGGAEALEQRDLEMYGLLFEALQEEPDPPGSIDGAAIERLLEMELTARISVLEWGAVALLLATGVVLVPGLTVLIGAVIRFLGAHWQPARLDILLTATMTAALLGFAGRGRSMKMREAR